MHTYTKKMLYPISAAINAPAKQPQQHTQHSNGRKAAKGSSSAIDLAQSCGDSNFGCGAYLMPAKARLSGAHTPAKPARAQSPGARRSPARFSPQHPLLLAPGCDARVQLRSYASARFSPTAQAAHPPGSQAAPALGLTLYGKWLVEGMRIARGAFSLESLTGGAYRAAVAAAYAAAGYLFVYLGTYYILGGLGSFLRMVFAIQFTAYIGAATWQTESFYDAVGTGTFGVAALYTASLGASSLQQKVLTIMVGLWASRLGIFLVSCRPHEIMHTYMSVAPLHFQIFIHVCV